MSGAYARVLLAEYVERAGRKKAALALGCTGPALSKAIAAGRTIFVEQAADGSVSATEISKFPGR
ncbi:Cro/CI family transcriptional regulator [Pseudomonas sp. 1912-s]|uniref:Cro/CI family transcriptional regulator n=1 Tax=Pseudomonas sp. 1912-s TaxID=3033802 RepID=UPI0023DFEBF5|nr:Cro/CI family transcriptional regulator [Pseudomonas sp. 1912-s]MDF3197576.1 Cro/CI family transcriptional regulator [Pseudomonas sp. 1912-s]